MVYKCRHTLAKIKFGNKIQSSASAPDIIAATEIKPKNYVRGITALDFFSSEPESNKQ